MFRRKKKTSTVMTYDPAIRVPVIRCSICTGEQVAALKIFQTEDLKRLC